MKLKLILIISFLSSQMTAQKNAIALTNAFFSSVGYERTVFKKEASRLKINTSIYASSTSYPSIIRAHRNWERDTEDNSYRVGTAVNFLIGERDSFLEVGIGLDYHWSLRIGSLPDKLVAPNLSVGYRKEWDKILVRTGVGFPEIIYLGIGCRY